MVVLSDARPAAPVLVAFGAPARQRRLTVALRPLLALPQLIALVALAPAVGVVMVIGWFSALVTGRLPRWAADRLVGWGRWQTRVAAYLLLLTDVYPPFSRDDAAYPVRVTASPDRLNRWSVAFRLLLGLPAMVVAATVLYGIATIVLVVSWLVVLVTGELPSSLHQVFAATVRYQARLNGYLTLVTSEYPWGLLGDPEPGTDGSGWQPAPPSPVDDPYWRMVLTPRAKNLTVFVVVLGVASVVGLNIVNALAGYNRLRNDEAATARVHSDYQSLSGAVVRYETITTSCESATRPLRCLTGAAQDMSHAFAGFVVRLTSLSVPPVASPARSVLVSDGASAVRAFAQLSASNTSGRYELVIETSDLSQLLVRFDRDYTELGIQLTKAE